MEKCDMCGKETPVMQLGVRYCSKCGESVIRVCRTCDTSPFYCKSCRERVGKVACDRCEGTGKMIAGRRGLMLIWKYKKCSKCKGTGFVFKEGKGWHESPDASGKAPDHRDAKLRAQAKGANNTPMVKTITELPPYIQKHASNYNGGTKVVLPYGYLITEEDAKQLPSAKKWLKQHGFQYDDRGYYWRSADEQQVQKRMQTEKFKQDLSRFLSQLAKKNRDDTTIPEFKRWLKEDVMEFERKSPREQIEEKIHYEKTIGNESKVFDSIHNFIDKWLSENIEEPRDSHIWYHGTTEDRYRKILADGEIKVSTAETSQHKDFAHDIGTISLAKHKGMAHFFSAISGMGKQNQIILHIDTRKLDQSAISKRGLFAHEAEILYHKNIPASAIVRDETVYVVRKQEAI